MGTSVLNIGYLGEGKYRTKDNGRQTSHYITWVHMLQRCYDRKRLETKPTYNECVVSEEWCNFQNFATWYDENYYEVGGEKMHLDKDILIKGNKVYSSETCIFVPQTINSLFIKRESKRGEFPIGVSWHKRDKNTRQHVTWVKGS